MREFKVAQVNGIPRLTIDGAVQPPVTFFSNTSAPDKEYIARLQIKMAGEHGVNIITVPCSAPVMQPRGERSFHSAVNALDVVLESNPDALILLRVSLSIYGREAAEWDKAHPGDAMRFAFKRDKPYSNDMADEVSVVGRNETSVTIASQAWLDAAIDTFDELHAYLSARPEYDDHILGYHIGCAETGEWFHFGLRERGVDIGETSRRGFARYLEAKYGTVDALNDAWETESVGGGVRTENVGGGIRSERAGGGSDNGNCGSGVDGYRGAYRSFDDVLIPGDIPGNDRMRPAERTLFTQPGDMRFIDYCDYASEIMSDRMIALTSACRRLTGGRKLIVCFYGYLFELYDARTGHFRLNKVLDSPDIDAFTSPVSYTDRNHGGVGALMSPADTITAHGKLWFVENDIRNCVVMRRAESDKWDWVKSVDSIERYNEVSTRETGQMLMHNLACWYMDLMCQGWHYHPVIWGHIRKLRELYADALPKLRPAAPDVAVAVDETALSCVAHADELGVNVLYRMRHAFYRAGVSFGFYTAKDIEEGTAAAAAKAVFWLTPFRMDAERSERLIAALAKNGAGIVFMHGFGRTPDSAAEFLTGMKLGVYAGRMAELDMEVTEPGFIPGGAPFLDQTGYRGGLPQRANPATYVEEGEGVTAFARYTQGPLKGKIGAAWRDCGGVRRVFVGGMLLTPGGLRAVCGLAGAHIYNNENDAFNAGNGIICLHTGEKGGRREISLPEEAEYYEPLTGTKYPKAPKLLLDMEPYTTKLLFDASKY